MEHDEEGRREGRDGKAAISVEDAGIERDHRHEDEKGSAMRAKRTASANFSGSPAKPGARIHQPRHDDLAEKGEGDEQHGEPRERLAGEGARSFRIGMEALGKKRDEGRIERALGEQPAEHVGDAESDEKRVRHRGSPEDGRDQNARTKPSTRLAMVMAPTVAKPR